MLGFATVKMWCKNKILYIIFAHRKVCKTQTEDWRKFYNCMKEICSSLQRSERLKGLSHELRWVLLYINRKLFSRSIVTHHEILILFKGHFTINKRMQGWRDNSQFTKENPAYERLYNSRWSEHCLMRQFLLWQPNSRCRKILHG